MSNQVGQTNPLETSFLHENLGDLEDEEVKEYLLWMDSFRPNRRRYFEAFGASLSHPIPSMEKAHVLEEKPLLAHLQYAYLGDLSTFPVIISSSLFFLLKKRGS